MGLAVSRFLDKGFAVQLEPNPGGELFSVEVKQGMETLVAEPKFLLPKNRRQKTACDKLVSDAEAAREAAAAAEAETLAAEAAALRSPRGVRERALFVG